MMILYYYLLITDIGMVNDKYVETECWPSNPPATGLRYRQPRQTTWDDPRETTSRSYSNQL
jgi:hypothetical protein